MLAKNFTLLFYLKKRSNYVSGKLPVYMRISVNGSRSEMSMGRGCEPEKWNNVSCRRTGTEFDTKEFNAYLDTVQSKVYQVYRSLLETGAELTAENVRKKLNAYLKEIADVCRVDKRLTFHLARHTFATTVTLTNGVPIESVSKMLGHNNINTTQIYAKIVDRKISEDMSILKTKFG